MDRGFLTSGRGGGADSDWGGGWDRRMKKERRRLTLSPLRDFDESVA